MCCPWRDKIKIKEVNKKYNFTIHAILLPILNSTFIFSRFSYIFFLIKLPYNFSLDWLQMAVKWRECSTIDCTLWIKYLLLIKYRFSSHSSFVLNSLENVFFKEVNQFGAVDKRICKLKTHFIYWMLEWCCVVFERGFSFYCNLLQFALAIDFYTHFILKVTRVNKYKENENLQANQNHLKNYINDISSCKSQQITKTEKNRNHLLRTIIFLWQQISF